MIVIISIIVIILIIIIFIIIIFSLLSLLLSSLLLLWLYTNSYTCFCDTIRSPLIQLTWLQATGSPQVTTVSSIKIAAKAPEVAWMSLT